MTEAGRRQAKVQWGLVCWAALVGSAALGTAVSPKVGWAQAPSRVEQPGAALLPPKTRPQEAPTSGDGRSPLATRPFIALWGAMKDFGRDTWQVASAPARLDRGSAMKVGGFLAVGGLMFAVDEDIADALDADADPDGNRGFLRDVGDFVEPVGLQGDTNVYFAGAAVLGYLTKQDWLKDPAKQILFSQWIGGMGRQLVGHLVGRQRPHVGEGAYSFEPGEGTSFPSGHSAVAFELAYVLSHHIDRLPATITLYALAAAMAFQRTDSNSHWASDAFLGSAWGYFVARTVVSAEDSERVSIEPVLDPGSRRVGVGLTIRF